MSKLRTNTDRLGNIVYCTTCADRHTNFVVKDNSEVECAYCGEVVGKLFTKEKKTLKALELRKNHQYEDVADCTHCGDGAGYDFEIKRHGPRWMVVAQCCGRNVGVLNG